MHFCAAAHGNGQSPGEDKHRPDCLAVSTCSNRGNTLEVDSPVHFPLNHYKPSWPVNPRLRYL
jgi:hypothetical protein